MASIFNGLHIGYSGLKTSQIAIDTTGHNIANAENPDYTRQRVVISPNPPLNTVPGDLGLGAKISEIVRIHDEFVYKRLKGASNDNEYNRFRMDTMDEISSYFPEIDKNGIYNAMQDYFDAWNDFSKNTDDSALKINLAQSARTFTATIRDTYDQIRGVQSSLDEQLRTSVDEINRLGRQIAELNVRINTDESAGNHANDLRDQRDKLELALSKLVDIAVSKGNLRPDMTVDPNLVESGSAYHLSIGGSSFVDGTTFHPILFENPEGERYGRIYYQRQDHVKFDITDFIRGGQVGAMLSLRDGDIDKTLESLDSFANTLVIQTNNLYAAHATDNMRGDIPLDGSQVISRSDLPIDTGGSFYVKVYDIDGNVVAKRKLTLADDATFRDVADAIEANAAADVSHVVVNDGNGFDDNGDNVDGNDVNDYLKATVGDTANPSPFAISLTQEARDRGYTFAIEEADPQNPSLFAGAVGLQRFFDRPADGSPDVARRITLNRSLDDNPTRIGGNAAPIAGDNGVANAMLQLQYEKVDFYAPANSKSVHSTDTLSGFFRMSVTAVADTTAAAHASYDTSEALLTAVVNEFDSISKVDIDEELTNLMKYQTGYSASAKVITTIDQMIQTLLGMKQ
ncbi:flagellar hook-associated protein FlgK [Hydrogenimonas sp.]